MRRILPLFFSLCLVYTVLAETTHNHAQAADESCPAVCFCNCCGAICASPASKSSAVPADAGATAAFSFDPVFIHRLAEDEIFHPPAV